MPTLTAKKLVEEIQNHIARHPESADWPVVIDNTAIESFYGTSTIVHIVLDLSDGARRFIADTTDQ